MIDAKTVVDRPKGPKGGGSKIAECIVGDQTASIVYTAKDDQGAWGMWILILMQIKNSVAYFAVELAQPGAYLSLQNANIEVHRGSMRLVLDKASGTAEAVEGQSFKPAVRLHGYAMRNGDSNLIRQVSVHLPVLFIHAGW